MSRLAKPVLAGFLSVWLFIAPLATSNLAFASPAFNNNCAHVECDSGTASRVTAITLISVVLFLISFGIYRDFVTKTASRDEMKKLAKNPPSKEKLQAVADEMKANPRKLSRAELEKEAIRQLLEEESQPLPAGQ